MSWSEYQEKSYRQRANYLAVYIANHLNVDNIIDLGCGSGNNTVYLLKKNKRVIAIDPYLNEKFILERIGEEQKNNLTLIEDSMEKVKLSKTDCLLSTFVIPFCEPNSFPDIWEKIVDSINPQGYLVANLFGIKDYRHNSEALTFTKEEVLSLLKNFEIIKWKEQEYTTEIDNRHWHYYDFIAQKK